MSKLLFYVPALRFFIPDTLPIPLAYYWLLVPGAFFALWQKRFEILLLAIIPVAGCFCSQMHREPPSHANPILGNTDELHNCRNSKLRLGLACKVNCYGVLAALILVEGLVPSIQYIYAKTKSPFSIHHYAQERSRRIAVFKKCCGRP